VSILGETFVDVSEREIANSGRLSKAQAATAQRKSVTKVRKLRKRIEHCASCSWGSANESPFTGTASTTSKLLLLTRLVMDSVSVCAWMPSRWQFLGMKRQFALVRELRLLIRVQ
jgi:hypothetical protein